MKQATLKGIIACSLLVLAGGVSQAQPAPSFRIVYEGGTHGVSNGGTSIGLPNVLFERAASSNTRVRITESGWGSLYNSGRYLTLESGGRISELLDFVENTPFQRGEREEVAVLVGRYAVYLVEPESDIELLLSEEARAGRFDDIRLETWHRTHLVNGDGNQAILLEEPNSTDQTIVDDPTLWEVRFRLVYQETLAGETDSTSILTLERRIGEGTRRLGWIRERVNELEGAAIFVSAGNSLEGRSWLEGQLLNLQRPHSWAGLSSVPLDLLVPAEEELAGGVDNLRQEANAGGTRLISANLMNADGTERLFPPSEIVELGTTRIAFIGLTDANIVNDLTPAVAEALTLGDPAEALATELTALRTREEGRPDLIVLLTLIGPEQLQELLADVGHLDLVIGRTAAGAVRDIERSIRLQAGSGPGEIAHRDRAPLLIADVGQWQVGRIDGFTTEETITELEQVNLTPDQSWAPVEPVLAEINRVRQEVYREAETILFPDLDQFLRNDAEIASIYLRHQQTADSLADGYTPEQALDTFPVVFSQGIWLSYVANIVRERTGADVAFMRAISMPYTLAGPIPEIFIHAALQGLDEIQTYTVDGETLEQLLAVRGSLATAPEAIEQENAPPAISGADIELELVGGRAIDQEADYLIAITDHLAAQTDFATILGEFEATTHFEIDPESGDLDSDDDGETVRLHNLVVDDLQRRIQVDPELGQTYWNALSPMLRDQGEEMVSLFIARISQISLAFSQVSRELSVDGYDTVRNSRVNQVDSTSLTVGSNLSLALDTAALVTTLGGELAYSELNVDDETTETADDLVGSLDFQLRFLEAGLFRSLMPYVTARYDTEVTPTEGTDGSDLPRQSELRDSLGFVVDFSENVPELRLGLFQEMDFAADEGRDVLGAELTLRENLELGALTQTLDIDATYFFPTDQDTIEDLEFTVAANFSLEVPILGNLALESFVDTLWFRGKLPENNDIGVSMIVGVGLSFSDVFRLPL